MYTINEDNKFASSMLQVKTERFIFIRYIIKEVHIITIIQITLVLQNNFIVDHYKVQYGFKCVVSRNTVLRMHIQHAILIKHYVRIKCIHTFGIIFVTIQI